MSDVLLDDTAKRIMQSAKRALSIMVIVMGMGGSFVAGAFWLNDTHTLAKEANDKAEDALIQVRHKADAEAVEHQLERLNDKVDKIHDLMIDQIH